MKKIFTFLMFLIITGFVFSQNQGVYMTGQLLVKYKDASAFAKARTLRSNLDVKCLGVIADLNVEWWSLPKNCDLGSDCLVDIPQWMAYLKQNEGDLVLVQPNYMYGGGSLPPNDTAFFRQWYLNNTGWNGCSDSIDVNALAAWDIRGNAKYAKVGILDTGIEWNHPDLKDNIWQNLGEDADHDSMTIVWNGSAWVRDPGDLNGIDEDMNGYVDDVIGWDFVNNDNNPLDDNGHGTHVAGIIGAKSNNTTGIAGIAGGGIQMMTLKCLDESGTGYSFSILTAMQYAINQGAMVTNHSYGGGAFDPLMFDYIDNNCKNAGQLLIAAAGNNHTNNDTDPMYPASYDSDIILSVGAHDCNGNPSAVSNFGSNSVDIFAPGDAIFSTDLNGSYSFRTGTSMAAPMVTAAVALAWKQFPASSPSAIKNRMLNTASDMNGINDLCVSNGRLNLFNVLNNYTNEAQANQESELFHGGANAINNMVLEGVYLWVATTVGMIKFNTQTKEMIFYHKNDSGLPNNYVTCITLDAQGNKWIGTKYGGIAKFDGINWTVYNTANTGNPGLPANHITCIKIDAQGNKWIGTWGNGMVKFDGTNWDNYNTANSGILDNNIKCITIDAQGNKWIGTDANGIVKFDGTYWVNFNTANSSLPFNTVNCITIDAQGNKWIGMDAAGVVRFNGSTWAPYNPQTGFSLHSINCITIDAQGNKWIGTYGDGLFNLAGGVYTYNSGWPCTYNNVNCIAIDAQGNKWLGPGYGCEQFGIIKFGSWANYPINNSIIVNQGIFCIKENSQGKIWIGTSGGGNPPSGNPALYEINGLNWYAHNISGDAVHFAIDTQNDKWIACGDGGGMKRFLNNGGFASYNTGNSSLPSNAVRHIAIDAQGNKWIATSMGLAKLNGVGGWTIYNVANTVNNGNPGLPSNDITCISIDSQGNKWVGTWGGGLAKFDGVTWTVYNVANTVINGNPGLPDNEIRCIFIDAQANKWIGTSGGLAKFDGTNWSIYNTLNSGLPHNHVKCMDIDAQGIKWIGTRMGVAKFDGTNWVVYNYYNSNVSDNDILSILIDSKGNKWIGTSNAGVSILYDANTSFSTPTFTTCLNSTLTFTNQTTDADSFTWKVNNQIIDTATHLTYTFTTAGVHRVELIAHKGTLDKSFFQYITVRAPVQVDLGQDTSVCHPNFVVATDAAAEYYLWKNLAGQLLDADSTHEDFTVTGAGVHSVVLEAIDYCGAVDRDTVVVTLSGDCVLPGDVNADGGVDMLDFVALQPLIGQTGTPRPSASTTLSYQNCPNWSGSQPAPYNTVNQKHGDCDGNGVINMADAAVIRQNATRTMRRQAGTDSTAYELKLKIENYIPYQWFYPGDTIWHDVELSREDGQPLTNIQRMAFNVRYNRNITANPVFKLNTSFMGTANLNLFPMVIRKGKRVDFGEIRIWGSSTGASKSNTGQVGTTPKSERIDTTHTTHSIFLTMTLNNASLTLNNGSKERIHSQTSQNTETMEIRLPWNRLDLTLYLDGAYDSTTQFMRTDLQTQNLIPKQHPYGDIAPFKEVEIPFGVVDWVEVQLRSVNNPTEIVDRRAAFLMEDGHVQSPYEADSGYFYMLAKPGNYYVVVKHRNHLAVMSHTPLNMSANPYVSINYDFTNNIGYGQNAQKTVGNEYVLWAGDTNGDGVVEYFNTTDDRSVIFSKLASPTDKTHIIQGYFLEDVNLDGRVQYSGAGNDRALILLNIGGSSVNGSLSSQVP